MMRQHADDGLSIRCECWAGQGKQSGGQIAHLIFGEFLPHRDCGLFGQGQREHFPHFFFHASVIGQGLIDNTLQQFSRVDTIHARRNAQNGERAPAQVGQVETDVCQVILKGLQKRHLRGGEIDHLWKQQSL